MAYKVQIELEVKDDGSAVVKNFDKNVAASLDNAKDSSKTLGSSLDVLKSNWVGMTVAVGAASLAIGKAWGVVGSWISASEEQAKVLGKQNALLKASGRDTDENRRMLSQLTNTIMANGIAMDDQVQSAQNMLLIYDKISIDSFPRVLDVANKISLLFDGDLKSATQSLAVALSDPEAGLRRLKEIGIIFNDTERETIKVMSDAGDVMGAQNMILSTLEQKYKDMPGAITEYQRTMAELGREIDNLKEKLGGPAAGALVWTIKMFRPESSGQAGTKEDLIKRGLYRETDADRAAAAETVARQAAAAKSANDAARTIIEKAAAQDRYLISLQEEKIILEEDIKRMDELFKSKAQAAPWDRIYGQATEDGSAPLGDPIKDASDTYKDMAQRRDEMQRAVLSTEERNAQRQIDLYGSIGQASTQMFNVISINANRTERSWMMALSSISSGMGGVAQQYAMFQKAGGFGGGLSALIPGLGLASAAIGIVGSIIDAVNYKEDKGTSGKDLASDSYREQKRTTLISQQKPANVYYNISNSFSADGGVVAVGPDGIPGAASAITGLTMRGIAQGYEDGRVSLPAEAA